MGASPNAISVLGMVAAVVAGMAFFATSVTADVGQRVLWFGGAVLCQIRLLCNLFDGMVAVARNIATPRGELYNEVPDRVSDAIVLIGLGYSAGGAVTLGYAAALMAVFVAYVRVMAKSAGAPNDFCGPLGKPQRMAVVICVALYLALAPESWRSAWSEASAWSEVKVALLIVIVGGLVTALRRLSRAAKYLERAAEKS